MPSDDGDTIARKLEITSSFLDILLARRLWNFRNNAYSTMQYAMFVLTRDIRGRDINELGVILRGRLDAQDETFASNPTFYVHQQNRRSIHQILARMTDYVETQSGRRSHFHEYVGGTGNDRYEVEHIWATKPERHQDEFAHPNDFAEYRNRIGGLLLLPKSFNAAYGADEYKAKLPHYYGQNILAQSLSPQAYERDPGFLAFVQRSGLPFRAHPEFKRADLDERQRLYELLAEQVWDPARVYPEPVSDEDLAELDLFEDADDAAGNGGNDTATDRADWVSRFGEPRLRVADLLVELLREVVDPSAELNYRKRHIGVRRGGHTDNFIIVSPKKKRPYTMVGFRMPETPVHDSQIRASGLDLFRRKRDRYLIRVTEQDFANRREALASLARAAAAGE